jgi:phosphopantetheinyl transferase
MSSVAVKTIAPPSLEGVSILCAPVQDWSLNDVPLASPSEVSGFATQKRREEHLTGRWLLGQSLRAWGVADLSVVEVVRDAFRAPSLAYIQGVWLRVALPHFSITHSDGWAFVALAGPELNIGLDAEPVHRTLAENAYDMMAKSTELAFLRSSPSHVFQAWTGKEAVQKCLGKGMHLNPRDIGIPIGSGRHDLSIENSNIQLEYWCQNGYHLSLALRPATPVEPTPEERLLEDTRQAMEADPTWGVGCKTQRSGA